MNSDYCSLQYLHYTKKKEPPNILLETYVPCRLLTHVSSYFGHHSLFWYGTDLKIPKFVWCTRIQKHFVSPVVNSHITQLWNVSLRLRVAVMSKSEWKDYSCGTSSPLVVQLIVPTMRSLWGMRRKRVLTMLFSNQPWDFAVCIVANHSSHVEAQLHFFMT